MYTSLTSQLNVLLGSPNYPGTVLGFNVLYFDGSVKWWSNTSNYLVNAVFNASTYQGPYNNGNADTRSNDLFWALVQQ
jgi:prepilin-type processing-associated H-X9-DG protein